MTSSECSKATNALTHYTDVTCPWCLMLSLWNLAFYTTMHLTQTDLLLIIYPNLPTPKLR